MQVGFWGMLLLNAVTEKSGEGGPHGSDAIPGQVTTALVLPCPGPGVVDGDSPRRQFVQQLLHCRRDPTVSGYNHGPF
jgi:hypothetical protein